MQNHCAHPVYMHYIHFCKYMFLCSIYYTSCTLADMTERGLFINYLPQFCVQAVFYVFFCENRKKKGKYIRLFINLKNIKLFQLALSDTLSMTKNISEHFFKNCFRLFFFFLAEEMHLRKLT